MNTVRGCGRRENSILTNPFNDSGAIQLGLCKASKVKGLSQSQVWGGIWHLVEQASVVGVFTINHKLLVTAQSAGEGRRPHSRRQTHSHHTMDHCLWVSDGFESGVDGFG